MTGTAGTKFSQQYFFSGTSGEAVGLSGQVNFQGASGNSTGTVTGVKGLAAANSSTFNISNVRGGYFQGQVSAGTATNVYGLYVDAPTGAASTITNSYGIYIKNQTANTTATSHFAIDQDGSSDTDYFAGFVQHDQIIQQKMGSAIASASTIAPTTPVVHVTGTTAIATITVPTQCGTSGYSCTVRLIPDGAFTTTTGGNIALASTAVVSRVLEMTYDPASAKWYPSY